MGEGQRTHGHHHREIIKKDTHKQKQDLASQVLTLTLLKLILVFHSLLRSLDNVVQSDRIEVVMSLL